jgi:hypothetical protein
MLLAPNKIICYYKLLLIKIRVGQMAFQESQTKHVHCTELELACVDLVLYCRGLSSRVAV